MRHIKLFEELNEDKKQDDFVNKFVNTFKESVRRKFIDESMLQSREKLAEAIVEMADVSFEIGDIEKTHPEEYKKILAQLIEIYLKESVDEALGKSSFPAGKYDAEYVRLMTRAQKSSAWDEKPDFLRTTATWSIQGKVNGKSESFMINTPGSYGAIYNFRGMTTDDYMKDAFSKSGDALSEWVDKAIVKKAAEMKMSNRVPLVWSRVKPTIPDELYQANIEEFNKAIASLGTGDSKAGQRRSDI